MDNKVFIIKVIQAMKGTLLGKVALLLVCGGLGLLGVSPFFDKYISAAAVEYLSLEVSDPSTYIGLMLILLGVLVAIGERFSELKVKSSDRGGERYYHHVSEFDKYMLKLENKIDRVDFQGVRRLYAVLFPDAKSGDFSISEELIDNVRYLIFHLADTERTHDPSYRNRYHPKIDVLAGIEGGLGYEITEVDFRPRAEVFMTGLYGLFGIVDEEYIEKVYANFGDIRKYRVIECYDRLATILKLVVDFSSNDDSSFIPENCQGLYSLDLKSYKKKIRRKNKDVTVSYLSFGMVHKVTIV